MRQYYVYMVMCIDGTYYVGMSNDADRRIAEHNLGIDPDCYTYSRRPVVRVYSETFHDPRSAIDAEKKLKRWSHRKKSALARGDWKSIGRFAKGKHRKDRLPPRN